MKFLWLMSIGLVACASNEAETTSLTVTSAEVAVDPDLAIKRITTDRCNRQLSCDNIGQGRTWQNRNACMTDVDKRTQTLLGTSCSSVDTTRLSACITEIRDQRCEEISQAPLSCEGLRLCR